jgi:hypothetical protein
MPPSITPVSIVQARERLRTTNCGSGKAEPLRCSSGRGSRCDDRVPTGAGPPVRLVSHQEPFAISAAPEHVIAPAANECLSAQGGARACRTDPEIRETLCTLTAHHPYRPLGRFVESLYEGADAFSILPVGRHRRAGDSAWIFRTVLLWITRSEPKRINEVERIAVRVAERGIASFLPDRVLLGELARSQAGAVHPSHLWFIGPAPPAAVAAELPLVPPNRSEQGLIPRG